MLEVSFTPLKPLPTSPDFYKYFFNQYSFIQVNDLCTRYAIEGIPKEEQMQAINVAINLGAEEIERNSVYLKAMGLLDPSLEERKIEDRGFSQDLLAVFSKLSQYKKDPLDWFLLTNEFMMVYAVCERTLAELLEASASTASIASTAPTNTPTIAVSTTASTVSKAPDSPNNNTTNGTTVNVCNAGLAGSSTTGAGINFIPNFIPERQLFAKLTQFLQRQGTLPLYKKILEHTSGGCLKSLEDVNAVWLYYTLLRHCVAHSAGVWNQRLSDRMSELDKSRLKNIEERMLIHPLYLGDYDPEEKPFFKNDYTVGSILEVNELQVNFFRNTVLRVVEGLEKLYRVIQQSAQIGTEQTSQQSASSASSTASAPPAPLTSSGQTTTETTATIESASSCVPESESPA